MEPVFVVGIGVSKQDLTSTQLDLIKSAEVLMGGRRHLDLFQDLSMEKREITGRISDTMDFIGHESRHRRIVVLASGDPLFFGIGERISRVLGPERVKILPNISAAAAAFSRINEPWGGAKILSLHGRNREFAVLEAIKSGAVVAILTDPKHSPKWLAGWLLERGVTQIQMAVFENLGAKGEHFGWYALRAAAEMAFEEPNVVILKPESSSQKERELVLGMPEEAYLHEEGLITKSEVRVVALAKLQLTPGLLLWDLGAGSGSVGLEASVLLGPGRIVAVEKHAGRVEQIRENARRYGVYNHEVIQGTVPGALEMLPPPDRIFIGGGGRELVDIATVAVGYLKPGGILVVNTVLMDNLTRVYNTLREAGMEVEVVQIQVSRGKTMPWSYRMETQHPVWILSAQRKDAYTR